MKYSYPFTVLLEKGGMASSYILLKSEIKTDSNFEFPAEAPPVRYIRFKVLETWGGMDFIHFTEFTFWGNVISNN